MPQRRNRRAGVEDLWHRSGLPKTPANRTARHGRGKRWRVRWVDDQGRERSESFDREIDAKARRDAVNADMQRGEYVDPRSGAQTFGALAQRFMTGRDVKPKTLSGEQSLLKSRILPRWESVQIGKIVESDIRTWITAMQREISSSRARQAFILFRQILDLAVADKALSKNPAQAMRAPRAKTSRDAVFLTVEQVHAIAGKMERESDAALTRFLAFTGLRWGEAVAVTVGALDYERHIVHVRRTYSEDGGRVIEGVPKSHATRWVPFPERMADELREIAGDRPRDADLFQTRDGKVLRSGNWTSRVLRPAVEAAAQTEDGDRDDNFPGKLRIHDLRHTAASIAIRSGANVKALQRMLGHESATMTLDVYAGLWDDDLRDVGASINAAAYPLRTGDDL